MVFTYTDTVRERMSMQDCVERYTFYKKELEKDIATCIWVDKFFSSQNYTETKYGRQWLGPSYSERRLMEKGRDDLVMKLFERNITSERLDLEKTLIIVDPSQAVNLTAALIALKIRNVDLNPPQPDFLESE